MTRAALYARFSSDLQSDASVEDQLRLCRALAASKGYVVVGEFSDAAISGSATANRPGVRRLMDLALSGGCDVVIAEHTDRLSRRGSGGWIIFEDLEARGVQYLTVQEGEITELQQGVSALVSGLKMKEVRQRTRRGLEGVIRAGRAAGGVAYGYRVPLAYDAHGERLRGLREIDEAQATTVRRIFTDYASGASPLARADALNREGVQAPRGTHWLASTILGSAERQVGILRNEMYRGVRVWGRAVLVKDRVSGRRRRVRGTGQMQRVEVPEMRIIDEALWGRVQARILGTSAPVAGIGQRRPLHLFSGLIRCGACGGAMTSAGTGDYLRCSARSNRGSGSCGNTRNPPYPRIESMVLAGIEANLLHPVAIDAALQAFRETIAADRQASASRKGPLERELEDVKRRAARLVREVEGGMPWAAVKDRHAELVGRQGVLEAKLAAAPASEVVKLHTGTAQAYRGVVGDLRNRLAKPVGAGARDAVRGLVSEIRFLPLERKGSFDLDVTADLMPLLGVNASGTGLVSARETGSCFLRSHDFTVKFRLAG